MYLLWDAMDTPGPNVNELRALAASLPPSERLAGAESADVLSALVAVVTHGRDILKAAEDGSIGVAQFFHDALSKHAAAHDQPEPVKGSSLTEPAPPATPAASTAVDYDKLAAAIVRAQESHASDTGNKTAPEQASSQGGII